MTARRGFTLLEVLVATVILSLGLMAILGSFMQSQKMMLAAKRFELAQKVLAWGEMLHPVPLPEDVHDDPLRNDRLNIDEESADEILNELERNETKIELSHQEREDLAGYTFAREVDDDADDDEELKRRGYIYTIRTTVAWGYNRATGKREEDVTIKLWRKE